MTSTTRSSIRVKPACPFRAARRGGRAMFVAGVCCIAGLQKARSFDADTARGSTACRRRQSEDEIRAGSTSVTRRLDRGFRACVR